MWRFGDIAGAFFRSVRSPRLFALPGDVLGHLGMCQQRLDRVMIPAQLLFVGNQIVDGPMAVPAKVDAALHLFAGEPLFEPLVASERAGDQVMEIVGFVRAT